MWLLLVVEAEPGEASVVATTTMVFGLTLVNSKIFKSEVSSLRDQEYSLIQQRVALHEC